MIKSRQQLIIKPNPQVNQTSCIFCGTEVTTRAPLELMTADEFKIVCEKCGYERAPELVKLLHYFYDHLIEFVPKTNDDKKSTIELYRVFTIINNFEVDDQTYDHVIIRWFVVDRKETVVPYAEAIKNYQFAKDQMHQYPETALKELFTEDEIIQFQSYLKEYQKMECEIEDVLLPIPFNSAGYGAISLENRPDINLLYEAENYHLPFKIAGYYDLSQAVNVTWRKNGVDFLQKILEKLNIEGGDVVHHHQLITELKDEGFCVETCLTKHELNKRC